MSVELAVAIGCVIAFVLGWIFSHKGDASIVPADVKNVVLSFDAKKKAEAERIDKESPNALLDDLNKPNP